MKYLHIQFNSTYMAPSDTPVTDSFTIEDINQTVSVTVQLTDTRLILPKDLSSLTVNNVAPTLYVFKTYPQYGKVYNTTDGGQSQLDSFSPVDVNLARIKYEHSGQCTSISYPVGGVTSSSIEAYIVMSDDGTQMQGYVDVNGNPLTPPVVHETVFLTDGFVIPPFAITPTPTPAPTDSTGSPAPTPTP